MASKKNIYLIPKTNLGKWSVRLIIIFFMLFLASNLIARLQEPRIDQTFFSNPLLSIPIFSAGIVGIIAFFAGIASILKHKERSIFVFLTTLIGIFILFFVLGEFLYPH